MGSGEADAVRVVPVDTSDTPPTAGITYKIDNVSNSTTAKTGNLTGSSWYEPYQTYPANNTYWTYNYSYTYYYYQITCPKRGCKTMNWLLLDKITPCKKCGSKLKAVSQQADYEVQIT